jgi:hypothetical protein
MPVPRLRDERLAWLAIQGDLDRLAHRGPMARLRALTGDRRRRRPPDDGSIVTLKMRPGAKANPREPNLGDIKLPRGSSKAMAKYSVAVYEVTTRLSPAERETLRNTGQVPDWFLDAVRAQAKKV